MNIARITKLRILKGKTDAFEAICADFAKQVKEKESETLYYSLCKSKDNPNTFIIYEEYPDEAAMAAHGRTIHFNDEWTKMGMFIEGNPETIVTDVLTR